MPIVGTDAKIVDLEDPRKELGVDQVGELMIKGPQVMQGYWNQTEEAAETLIDGWLRTGDIACMDEEGYFYIVDRKPVTTFTPGQTATAAEIGRFCRERLAPYKQPCKVVFRDEPNLWLAKSYAANYAKKR